MAIQTLNTELDAINLCLSGIGREPVDNIDTADLDAAMAKQLLDQTSIDIQVNGGRGWWFNREQGWSLQPDPRNGVTKVPNNALSIIKARAHYYDATHRLVIRGDKVYDKQTHSFDLSTLVGSSGAIEFELVMLLSYEDLPHTARSAIAWQTRLTFAADTEGDPNTVQMMQGHVERSLAMMSGEERKQSRTNYFNNPRHQNALFRIQGQNSRYF